MDNKLGKALSRVNEVEGNREEEGRVERKELLLVGAVDFVVPLVQRGATKARQGVSYNILLLVVAVHAHSKERKRDDVAQI